MPYMPTHTALDLNVLRVLGSSAFREDCDRSGSGPRQ